MDKIICLGKNYLDHAKELGDAVPDQPVLFLKPPSTLRAAKLRGDVLEAELPRGRGEVHPECEIVLFLNQKNQIEWVTLGLDMTLRDEQSQLKKKGHPWEIAKVFKDSSIVGPRLRVSEFLGDSGYLDAEFSLTVDGGVRQKAKGVEMRLSATECVAYSQGYFPLCEGDAIFTGTPAGVGPVSPGQTAQMHWAGQLLYSVRFR